MNIFILLYMILLYILLHIFVTYVQQNYLFKMHNQECKNSVALIIFAVFLIAQSIRYLFDTIK